MAEPITLPKPRPIKNPPIYANDRPFTIGRRPDPKWIARETCGGYPEYTKFVGSKVRRWPAQRRAEVVSTALDPPPVDRPRVEWDGPRYELISKIRETPREVYTTGWRTAREREARELVLPLYGVIESSARNLSRVFFTRNVPPPCETRYTGFFLFPSPRVSSFPSFPTNRAPIKRAMLLRSIPPSSPSSPAL